jgi:hypothetical protein
MVRKKKMPSVASRTADAASAAMTLVSPQCEIPDWSVPALDRPYTKAATPPVPVIAHGRSNRPRRRSDSTSARGAAKAVKIPIGTFTNITHRHDR